MPSRDSEALVTFNGYLKLLHAASPYEWLATRCPCHAIPVIPVERLLNRSDLPSATGIEPLCRRIHLDCGRLIIAAMPLSSVSLVPQAPKWRKWSKGPKPPKLSGKEPKIIESIHEGEKWRSVGSGTHRTSTDEKELQRPERHKSPYQGM
eukprot:1153379-Pelagomonas_calceolata.AAC.5